MTAKEALNLLKYKCYGDIFVEVRQRVAAFKYSNRFYKDKYENQDDMLDSAYRFLNQSIDPAFIKYCADCENYELADYIKMLLDLD